MKYLNYWDCIKFYVVTNTRESYTILDKVFRSTKIYVYEQRFQELQHLKALTNS